MKGYNKPLLFTNESLKNEVLCQDSTGAGQDQPVEEKNVRETF